MFSRLIPAILVVTAAASCGVSHEVEQGELLTVESLTASDPGPGGGLRAIVDGDLSTGWAGPEAPYWFEVDLGRLADVDVVRLRLGAPTEAVVRVHAGVHADPGRQPASFKGELGSGEWLEADVGYEARFVRIWVDQASDASTWTEIEVIGASTSG